MAWISEVHVLKSCRLLRWIGYNPHSNSSIHAFCDASERVCGAVLHLRSTHECTTTIESHIAPLKMIPLPRLELLATFIGASLLSYSCTATDLNVREAVLRSDSTVALEWIRHDSNKLKTFVCNCVIEIQRFTKAT